MTPDCSENELREVSRAFRMERGVPTLSLPFKKLNDRATIPTYGSNGAAGLDLYANFMDEPGNCHYLPPGERKLFKTGISTAIPRGFYGRIAPRSGLAYKHGIDVMAGVIDEDYRGDIGIILINLGFEPFIVRHGDRIAQFIITPYQPCLAVPCLELEDTARGVGGWGSTGK